MVTPEDIFSADQVLTVEKAKQLIGKKIYCTFPVFHMNKHKVDEIVINKVIEAENRPGYFTLNCEGEGGAYYAHPDNIYAGDAFTCGDIDRPVFYIEA